MGKKSVSIILSLAILFTVIPLSLGMKNDVLATEYPVNSPVGQYGAI